MTRNGEKKTPNGEGTTGNLLEMLSARANFLREFVNVAEGHIRLRAHEQLVASLTAKNEKPGSAGKTERMESLMSRPQESPHLRRVAPSWEDQIEEAHTELANIEIWMSSLEGGKMTGFVEDARAAGLITQRPEWW